MKTALLTETPTHILLVGPPASAKTLFETKISELNNAYMTVGSQVTKAGLTQLLFTYDVKYLIIDEIEDLDDANTAILLYLMQNQRVVETKYGRTREKVSNTWVIGSCNNKAKLRPALLSRFAVIEFKEYSDEEYKRVVVTLLTRNGKSKEFAEKIADSCLYRLKSRDVRDALRIAQLASVGTMDADKIIETLVKYGKNHDKPFFR